MQKDIDSVDYTLDSKIVYQDKLPLSIASATSSDFLSPGEEKKNLNLLRAFWLFHETRADDLKESPELQSHIERIELKLDMQSEMLSLLLQQTVKLPTPVDFSLSAEHLTAIHDTLYSQGSLVRAELYLLPEYPKPLTFLARVVGEDSIGSAYAGKFEICELDILAREMLEKILFRHHRRQIAQLRHSKT